MKHEASLSRPTADLNHSFSLTAFIASNLSKIFYMAVAVLIFLGWSNKSNSNLSPETGLGYLLGIIGGSLMLLLLLYPLRKKIRLMHRLGLVKHWFKMHMLFGVIGPVAILFHANFSLGSVNSNLAMFSMIIVASSGLVGRYLYAKIHHGLYGRKADLQELRNSLMLSKGKVGGHFSISNKAAKMIKSAERKSLKNRNIIFATILWPYIFLHNKLTKIRLKKLFYKEFMSVSKSKHWDKKIVRQLTKKAHQEVSEYIDGLYTIFGFRVFESLFSLWHVLHLPLFFLLVITGIVHVIVVHSY